MTPQQRDELVEEIHKRLKTAYELARAGEDTEDGRKAIDHFYHLHLNNYPGFAYDLIQSKINEAEIRGEITGKKLAYQELIMISGEYHNDPYEYVVRKHDIAERLQGLNKFDLSQPIFRDKAPQLNPTPKGDTND